MIHGSKLPWISAKTKWQNILHVLSLAAQLLFLHCKTWTYLTTPTACFLAARKVSVSLWRNTHTAAQAQTSKISDHGHRRNRMLSSILKNTSSGQHAVRYDRQCLCWEESILNLLSKRSVISGKLSLKSNKQKVGLLAKLASESVGNLHYSLKTLWKRPQKGCKPCH